MLETTILVGLIGLAFLGPDKKIDAVGCWVLSTSPAPPREWFDSAVVFDAPSVTVELTRSRVEPIFGSPEEFKEKRYLVKPLLGLSQDAQTQAYWKATRRHGIEIVWTRLLYGLRAALEPKAGRLVGTAQKFTDVAGPPLPAIQVTAEKVACPVQPPMGRDSVHR
jgi:hypothetical protein